MKRNETAAGNCSICGGNFARNDLVPSQVVREALRETIRKEQPAWEPSGFVCRDDLKRIRATYIQDLLSSERGELTDLEQQVLASLREHELLTSNIEDDSSANWTFGDRLSDRIASFGGSWRFLISFGVFMALWVIANSLVMFYKPADPYPFILLNLVLSCLAAIQAPIIMMSQNRQEVKDRVRSQHDYQVNLKAELEIRTLHQKMDHLLSHQWDRLVEIQNVQLEILSELEGKK